MMELRQERLPPLIPSKEIKLTIAKQVFAVAAAMLFALKALGVSFGSLDLTAAGLFCLTIARPKVQYN